MENSPYVPNNYTEDSGLAESSRNESNPSALYTPTSSLLCSRKRKIIEGFPNHKSFNAKQISSVESIESPCITSSRILSSTLNDSITTGVEKCTIDSLAANYYLERSELDTSNTSSFLRRIKEPTTPAKKGTKRFCNNNASPRLSPLLKLGSPERNGILYPTLQPNSTRFSDSKRCSPAKKCLFTSNLRKDPVAFFYGKHRDMYDIILKIFLQLGDEDLYASSKVCRNWKKAITTNVNLKRRLQLYIRNKIMNKENSYDSPFFTLNVTAGFNQVKQSTPIEQPVSTMYELTNSLTEGQHLERCFACNKPEAIVEKNISQCTNFRCGTIRCLKCNSISKMGPEHFHDNCQQSMLVIEKPSPRYSLLSSPRRYQNENGIPTIFMDDSLNTSVSLNSSGYLTDSDFSQSQRHSSSFSNKKKVRDISQILKTCNTRNTKSPEKNWERRNSILPVVPSTRKKVEIIEPSSPPKVSYVACTKKSKRALKRLQL